MEIIRDQEKLREWEKQLRLDKNEKRTTNIWINNMIKDKGGVSDTI